MTDFVPAPGAMGVAAWLLAFLVGIAVWGARRMPRAWWLSGALLPALLGQVGTWRAGPGLAFPHEDPAAAAAALATAVVPEAHGYFAGASVALVLAVVGRRRTSEARPPGPGAPAGVLGATLVAGLAGGPSLWLLSGASMALLLVLLASRSREPLVACAAVLGVGLAWLGVRHFLLFELHQPLTAGGLDGLVEVLAPRTEALRASTIAGPGWMVAALAAAWTSLRPREVRRLEPAVLLPCTGVVCAVLMGSLNTRALAPLHTTVAGGRLPRALPELPEIRRSLPAEGRCLAWLSERGWRLVHRWSAERCRPGGPTVVGAPAQEKAASIFVAPWLESGQRLELLGRPPVPATAGPLAALSWRSVPVLWVEGPPPVRVPAEAPDLERIERWLDLQLRDGSEQQTSADVWIFDRPEGDTILLDSGDVVVAGSRERRRSIVRRQLSLGEHPRLVLVLGERWTVQHAIDLCTEARVSVGPYLPCVWIGER